MSRGQQTQYSPVILPLVRCAAHFGATADEIANYLGVSTACLYKWRMNQPELVEALKRGREASDDRVEDSLYKRALAGDVTACIFYLKNRRPDRWRDVQHLDQAVGHYILSDRPMTEQEWIEARADRAKPVQQTVSTVLDQETKPLE